MAEGQETPLRGQETSESRDSLAKLSQVIQVWRWPLFNAFIDPNVVLRITIPKQP